MSLLRRVLAKVPLAEALSFRSLRQRLSLVPVAVVLVVSLVAAFFIHQRAQRELYDSREQLARGLADNIALHLTDQLKEVRDELTSWGRYFAATSLREFSGASDQDIASAIGHIWQGRADRYSELRGTLAADTGRGARRVEMSYIGG